MAAKHNLKVQQARSKAVPILLSQSSTVVVSMFRLPGFGAVHLCWKAAELCELSELIGVNAAVKQGCCHPASQSSTGAVSLEQGPSLWLLASL